MYSNNVLKVASEIVCNYSYLKTGAKTLIQRYDVTPDDVAEARAMVRSLGIAYTNTAEENNKAFANSINSALIVESVKAGYLILNDIDKESTVLPEVKFGEMTTFYTEDKIESETDVLKILNINAQNFYIKQMWVKTKDNGYEVSVMVGVNRGDGADVVSNTELVSVFSTIKPLTLPSFVPKVISKRFGVLCLFDAHLGKVSHTEYVGETSHLGTQIPELYAYYAQLKQQIVTSGIKKVIIPIGNDFFNVDDTRLTTTRNTPQDNTKNLYSVYKTGLTFYTTVISDLVQMGIEVEGILVAGNHAEYSEMILAISLQRLFADSKGVVIDDTPIARKYRLYGSTLLGFAHGTMKPEKYAELLPFDAKEYWASAKNIEILLGDKHHEKSYAKTPSPYAECTGILVRNLSSTSKTDFWHYNQGYVHATRRAYLLVYHEEQGIENIYHAVIDAD